MAKRVWKDPRLVKRASKERRTDVDGRAYDCLGERYRVAELRVLLRNEDIIAYAKQPVFRLGEDHVYTADFLVMNRHGMWAEDLKGGPEEASFQLIKRLWRKYGPCSLFIMERKGQRCVVRETVYGKAAKETE